MYDCLNGINTNIYKLVPLFFAIVDIFMMHSLQKERESIQVLIGISQKCGISIHKRKAAYEYTITRINLVKYNIYHPDTIHTLVQCRFNVVHNGIQRWASVVLTAGAWLAQRCNTTLIQ